MAQNNIKIEKGGTAIGQATKIDNFLHNLIIKIIIFILYILFAISALALLANFVSLISLTQAETSYSNLVIFFFLLYLAPRLFYRARLSHPKPKDLPKILENIQSGQSENLYAAFSLNLAKTWNSFLKIDPKKQNIQNLIEEMLKNQDMNFIIARIGVSNSIIKEYIKLSKNPLKQETIIRALKIAISESHHQIETGDLFVALAETDSGLKKFLNDSSLDIQDLANIVYWQTTVIRNQQKYQKGPFDPDDLHLNGGVGRDWAYGFTQEVEQFARDLTDAIASSGLNLAIIGRNKEISQIEEALTKHQGGNAILVGEPGVGKKSTIIGFAERVYKGKISGSLAHKHILEIDIDALLSGMGDKGDITARLSIILSEAARAGNVMIFIENIHDLFSSGDAGRVNASEVILPFLEIPNFYILGTTDPKSYAKYIEQNSSISQKFSKINIEEPNSGQMIRILEEVVPTIEYHTKSLITYTTLKETVHSADKYIMNIPNPEKSISLLDGAAAKASAKRGETIITQKDLLSYISEKYDLPASEVNPNEKERLLKLEQIIEKRVVGQKEAVSAISNAMRRARAGITDSKKPIGTFLFLGTTGVGKTETAKALAEAYFGAEDRMIRFDMSEYQNKQDIYRFIGGSLGDKEEPGILTTAVRERPFSLLLFDEIEKANHDILDLFLQILDEGRLTDGNGRKVSFTNTIIICTSNAGSLLLKKSIQSGIEYESLKKTVLNYIQEENIYRPEFLNRFTGVILFSPLGRDEIYKIATLMTKELITNIKNTQNIDLNITSGAIARLATLGYDPENGARPMSRVIQEKIEDLLAKKLLAGSLKKGDSIEISESDII